MTVGITYDRTTNPVVVQVQTIGAENLYTVVWNPDTSFILRAVTMKWNLVAGSTLSDIQLLCSPSNVTVAIQGTGTGDATAAKTYGQGSWTPNLYCPRGSILQLKNWGTVAGDIVTMLLAIEVLVKERNTSTVEVVG